jgi:hypothetical protein
MREHMTGKIEIVGQARGQPLPRRRSYDKVVENIEKWVNSSGLQKPTSGLDPSPISHGAGACPRLVARDR